MKRHFSRSSLSAFIFCLILIFCLSCQHSNDSSTINFTPEKVEALDSFLTRLHHTFPIPGIAVAIVKDDEVLYKTIGYRDQSQALPLMDTTPFFMGNLSELMAATAVIKLVQSGKIKLQDPVVKYLPYFKLADSSYRQIQIKHLLTHTSGVPPHDALWDLPTYDPKSLELTTRSISVQQPEFSPPGSRVKRSQFNYDILADLIEKASGMSFEDYMNHIVLQPLGMTHAAYYASPIQNNLVAIPHNIDNWLTYSLTKSKYYPHNREHAGSIGLHASVKDISSWMSMLLHEGKVGNEMFLDKDHIQELLNPDYKTGEDSYVGLGWEIKKQNGTLYYSKGHYIGGFSADITLIPDQKIGVLVMSNIAEEFDPSVITDQILLWLKGEKLNTPKMPVNIVMGRMLDSDNCLDSTLNFYTHLKKQYPDRYDYSHAALSKLGVNLMHKLGRKEDAIRVFDFALKQYPSSVYAHIDLAEAYVVNKNINLAEKEIEIVKKLSSEKNEPAVASHLAYLTKTINIMKEEKHEMHSEDYLSN